MTNLDKRWTKAEENDKDGPMAFIQSRQAAEAKDGRTLMQKHFWGGLIVSHLHQQSDSSSVFARVTKFQIQSTNGQVVGRESNRTTFYIEKQGSSTHEGARYQRNFCFN